MYNLLMSANVESWEKETPFELENERIFEYTNSDIKKRYKNLQPKDVDIIRNIPSIFAYEKGCGKNPKFGYITDIKKRAGEKIIIEYKIIGLEKFLTHADLLDMPFDLDIEKFEMNRTHWAIKDVDLPKEIKKKGVILPNNTKDNQETTPKISEIHTADDGVLTLRPNLYGISIDLKALWRHMQNKKKKNGK